MDINIKRFMKIGIDEKTSKNAIKNESFSKTLLDIINYTGKEEHSKKVGNLLYNLAGKVGFMFKENIDVLAKKISNGEINKNLQIAKSIEYFQKNHKIIDKDDIISLDKFIGVGIEVSDEEIILYIKIFLNNNREIIINKEGKFSTPDLMKSLKSGLEFAEPADITKHYMKLGNEFVKTLNIKKEPKIKKKKIEVNNEIIKEEKFRHKLTKLLGRDMNTSINTEELLKWHKNKFNGKILTRFPPEPNGFLHIGHCQAMNFSFEMAGAYNGETYLRYDDTNPEAENEVYIKKIKENVEFMGFKPWKITHSSENFDKLYLLAVELIKKGKAFCCFLTKEKSKELRENKKPSPFRNTTWEENLKVFEKMKKGAYKSGEVVLRAKIDYQSNENTLRDPTIYRIKYIAHPHVGDKWCIYPLYDFVHGICDSLEGITHSFCTLEFEGRRELYYWFLNELNLYRPYVWEFSRLNITYTILSKRKINKLIDLGIVDSWNDPRLFTIDGMRKRGITEKDIKDFLNIIGMTRRGDKVIQVEQLDNCIRNNLNNDSIRSFGIIEPIELELINLDNEEDIEILDYPQIKNSKEFHKIKLTKHIYVDLSDVKEKDEKDFYGISPNKYVRLKYGPIINIISVEKKNDKFFIKAKLEKNYNKKVKGTLHWISKEESIKCKFILLEKLFNSKDPESEGDFLKVLNKKSKIIKHGVFNKYLILKIKHNLKIQFERLGYFNVDTDSDIEKNDLKFLRIISLKEDKTKNK